MVPSLALELAKDLIVKQGVISGLLLLLVLTAMYQAQTSHKVRRAIAESQMLREEIQKEQILSQTLRLEMTSLSEADRVSSLANKKLGMVEVTNENEKIVSLK